MNWEIIFRIEKALNNILNKWDSSCSCASELHVTINLPLKEKNPNSALAREEPLLAEPLRDHRTVSFK